MNGDLARRSDSLDEAIRLLEQAVRLIRAERGSTSSAEAWRLTEREAEVLRLLREGRTNREIALALHISVHTARTHVSRVLGKLYVRSRWQLLEAVDDLRVELRSARRKPSLLVISHA